MAVANMWGSLSASARDAALVLLGAWLAGVHDMIALAGATGIAFLVALFARNRHARQVLTTARQVDWARSLRDFRNNLTILTAHLRSAIETTAHRILPPGVGWVDVAAKSRWPQMGNEPLRGWSGRMGSWMNTDERQALDVARYVEGVERNTIPFQVARSHLTDALKEWRGWREDQDTAPLIDQCVTEHRDAIVMLAYLEIAHADAAQMNSPPPAWRDFPTLWPVVATVRQIPEKG